MHKIRTFPNKNRIYPEEILKNIPKKKKRERDNNPRMKTKLGKGTILL